MQTSMAFTLQIFGFAYTEQEELLTSRMGGKCQNKHPIIHDTSSCWFKLALCRPCVENGSDLSSKWMCLCVQCGALVCVF